MKTPTRTITLDIYELREINFAIVAYEKLQRRRGRAIAKGKIKSIRLSEHVMHVTDIVALGEKIREEYSAAANELAIARTESP